MITSFHGVGAYFGQRNPMALGRQVSTALSGVEICTADRPIGAFGIVVGGDCRAVFETDVYSHIATDGNRRAGGECAWMERFATKVESQSEYESFAIEATQRANHEKTYTEAWVSAHSLRAVWVKDWASESTKKAARIIARHRGVPLLTVTGTTRIWDVLDNHNLPIKWRKSA